MFCIKILILKRCKILKKIAIIFYLFLIQIFELLIMFQSWILFSLFLIDLFSEQMIFSFIPVISYQLLSSFFWNFLLIIIFTL